MASFAEIAGVCIDRQIHYDTIIFKDRANDRNIIRHLILQISFSKAKSQIDTAMFAIQEERNC